MRRLIRPIYLSLLLLPLTVAAADFSDLPPAAQVEQALRTYPMVRAAEAALRAEAANRDRLAAGPHEFALRLSSQRRHERAPDIATRDHEIGIERAIRLPGKSARDTEIGAAGVAQAQFALGDALHESARLLLKSWFDWQREGAAARDWAAQVAVLRTQHAAILKKVGAGETAKLEALLSEAQLAQAEAQQMQAQARRERAASDLAQHFPGIILPETLVPSSPQAVADNPAQWRERILAHNHELAVARAASRRGTLLARQLDAERLPDPTLGLKLASERDGQDRIIGLQVTIPLPGAARAASARAGTAEADATYAREALALARVEAEARRTVGLAQGAHATWRLLADVATRMEDNARLLEKAWRLGEGQFGELQTARRQAIEARLAATQAQLDANEARYRLLLDAHELWPLDDDGDDH
ncbi:MAG: TolC family protein [Rhodocyclaceae bacterium]|nr:TolC family protein [Rhodocyclaceae bacterium]